MNYTVKLYLSTKTGVIDTNVKVFSDDCVEIAYRMIEAGMFGTMNKRYWNFGFGDTEFVHALLPMYRKVEKNGLVRYLPRIAPQRVRGSHQSLYLTLETLAESSDTASRLYLRRPGGPEESQTDTAPPVDQTNVVDMVVQGSADGPETAVTKNEIAEEIRALEEHLNRRSMTDDLPAPEIVRMEDGTAILVTEWQQVDLPKVAADAEGLMEQATREGVAEPAQGQGTSGDVVLVEPRDIVWEHVPRAGLFEQADGDSK